MRPGLPGGTVSGGRGVTMVKSNPVGDSIEAGALLAGDVLTAPGTSASVVVIFRPAAHGGLLRLAAVARETTSALIRRISSIGVSRVRGAQ